MQEAPVYVIDRSARLREQERAAFKAVWRWYRRTGGWGVAIACNAGTPVVAVPTVDREEDRSEGCWLLVEYHYYKEARRVHEELQRRRAARGGRALGQGWGSVPFDGAAQREADHDLPGNPRSPGRLAGADRRAEGGHLHPGRAAGAGGSR